MKQLLDLAQALSVPLSPTAAQALVRYEELLREVAVPRGLVGERDAGRLLTRHLGDSLRAAVAFSPTDQSAYDLGSGAGLPGLVLAAALPGVRFGLVEPARRRVAFLEMAIAALGLANAEVLPVRAEQLSEPVDVCLARALGPLERSWELARPLLRRGGRLVYFAGSGFRPPPDMPAVAEIRLVRAEMLASSGPLVIITHQ